MLTIADTSRMAASHDDEGDDTLNKHRRDALEAIINTKFLGSAANFARHISKSDAQVSQWRNGVRNIGSNTAMLIERLCDLPPGTVVDPRTVQEDRVPYGPAASPVAAAIKQEQEQDGFAMLEKALARLLIIGKRKDEILEAARIAHAEALEYQQAWEQMMRERGGKL